MAAKGSKEYIDWSTQMGDILSQLGIYEKDQARDRRGKRIGKSPDNPYTSGVPSWDWEKAQTNTYEERQAEARKAIAGDLEQFHSDFQDEYGYHWDDAQSLRDADKAWKFEGDAVSGYNKTWEDLKGTATGDALQGLLDEGYHKPYDQSFDEYDKSIGWGFDKWNQETHHFKPNQPANTRVRESGYYTAGETDKLGLDLQRVDSTQFVASSGDANKDLYRDLYRNAIDWDSYNQKDSMWQQAATMARENIDLKNLSNEERVGIYGIDWLGNTDAEGNAYGSFDREDEIRQVNQWMADRGWVMGDESTWNAELLNEPKLLDVSDSPKPVKGLPGPDSGTGGPLTWLDGQEPLMDPLTDIGHAVNPILDVAANPPATEGQVYSHQSIAGATPEQLAQIQADMDAQRDEYQTMLDSFKATSEAEKAELMASFDQQMEDYKLQQIEENKQKEAQTQAEFTNWWGEQQDALVTKYENLLNQATTDHQVALIEQQKAFEQTQLDQEASWNSELQELSKKDDVYQSQISELKGELGIQEDLYGNLASDYSGLQSDYSGLQSDFGGLQSEFGSAKADWALQAGDFKAEIGDLTGQIGGLETTLGEYTKQNKELQAAVKRNEELSIQNAERARVSASYGSQGRPMNKQVQGVRTINELTPAGTYGGGTTGSFNRKGLRIKNLNI